MVREASSTQPNSKERGKLEQFLAGYQIGWSTKDAKKLDRDFNARERFGLDEFQYDLFGKLFASSCIDKDAYHFQSLKRFISAKSFIHTLDRASESAREILQNYVDKRTKLVREDVSKIVDEEITKRGEPYDQAWRDEQVDRESERITGNIHKITMAANRLAAIHMQNRKTSPTRTQLLNMAIDNIGLLK